MKKKGVVKKSKTEMLLAAGSKIATFDADGKIVNYLVVSDTSLKLEHDARLFPTRR